MLYEKAGLRNLKYNLERANDERLFSTAAGEGFCLRVWWEIEIKIEGFFVETRVNRAGGCDCERQIQEDDGSGKWVHYPSETAKRHGSFE